jgi:Piwi domain
MQARLWWTSIPRSLPLPALFVGIDVSHAPKVFDPDQRAFMRKKSCAAIVTVVVRGGPSDTVEMFSTTSTKYPGQEACLEFDLKENIEGTIRACNVNPACVIGWRDGISDTAFEELAAEEVRGIRAALGAAHDDPGSKRKTRDDVPVAYVICQKSVNNKFLCLQDGAVHSAPSGTLVSSLCGWDADHERPHETFFINGRAPPFSTAKPVRFVVYERDEQLSDVPLPELTWGQCHEYANWTGAIKQPAVTKMAHKLSKLAGTFADCGDSIDHKGLANRAYFL